MKFKHRETGEVLDIRTVQIYVDYEPSRYKNSATGDWLDDYDMIEDNLGVSVMDTIKVRKGSNDGYGLRG
jgi:hypothetical protein